MNRRIATSCLVMLGVIFVICLDCGHADEIDPGRVLMEKVRDLNHTTRKWTDSKQRLAVTVYSSRGGEQSQRMELLTKKYGDTASKTVVLFQDPPRVRGTGVLQWVDPPKPNQTWLYLPALKRVRQISGSSQRDSFAATDFSYEDLSIRGEIADWSADEASVQLRGDDPCDGHSCAIIEVTPKTIDISYEKIRLWLGRDDFVVHKMEFDEAGRRVKTLVMSDVRPVGAIPTAHRLEMRNERSGSRTVVAVDEVAYDTGLTDTLFRTDYLEQRS